MKRLSHISGLKLWAMLLLAGSTLGSCNILDEEEMDCAVYVSFKYDMNMEFTDAFSNAVNSVTLYAFDKDGILAFQKTEEGEPLKQDGYRMRLDDISRSEKAQYDFITWAGEPDNESFSIPVLTVGKSTKEELICQLNRAGNGIVNDDLDDLFHGQANDLSFGRSTSVVDEVSIPLTKNTNNIRIILQHVTGNPINVNDFKFIITDKNGKMNYDNTLMADERLTYHAWYTANGYVGMDKVEGRQEGVSEVNVAIAELTVARLMTDEEPILTVIGKDDKVVLSIPLVDCALLYKRAKYNNMSAQEFLDREDEYNLTFFLDENNKWISSSIIINSWKLVFNDMEL